MEERQKGKILLYDLCQVPDGWTVGEVLDIIKSEKICYYDSRKGSGEPKVTDFGGDDSGEFDEIRFVDVSKE